MWLPCQLGPVQLGSKECLFALRIWNLIRSPSKRLKLSLASLRNHPAQLGIIVVGEIQERRRRSKFLSLKKHGHKGRSKHERRSDLGAAHPRFMADTLALGTIADLIMILHKPYKAMPGQTHHFATVVS